MKTTTLQVSDNIALQLYYDYAERAEKKRNEVALLQTQIENAKKALIEIESLLKQLPCSKKDSPQLSLLEKRENGSVVGNGYDKEWYWGEKITYLTKKLEYPIKTEDILNEILKLEPDIKTGKPKILTTIRPVISGFINNGELLKFHKKGVKGNFIIHKEWKEHRVSKEQYNKVINELGLEEIKKEQ